MPLKKIDKVTRWRKTGVNSYGEDTYGDPVVLDLRWEDYVTEATTEHGDPFMSRGVVYGDIAGTMKVEDRVIKGDDITVDISTSYIIKSIKTSRNGGGTRFLFAAYLSR